MIVFFDKFVLKKDSNPGPCLLTVEKVYNKTFLKSGIEGNLKRGHLVEFSVGGDISSSGLQQHVLARDFPVFL